MMVLTINNGQNGNGAASIVLLVVVECYSFFLQRQVLVYTVSMVSVTVIEQYVKILSQTIVDLNNCRLGINSSGEVLFYQ